MKNKLNTLTDGLLEELKDLYSAENQLLKALPKMQSKATNQKLKQAFHAHLLETEGHVKRLDEIGALLEVKLSGKTCKAMQGLIDEGKEVLEKESENKALLDAILIGAARRVEHYEMAAYDTALSMASELDQEDVAKLLEKTLDEEMRSEKKLASICKDEILYQANVDAHVNGEHKGERERERERERRARMACHSLSALFLTL